MLHAWEKCLICAIYNNHKNSPKSISINDYPPFNAISVSLFVISTCGCSSKNLLMFSCIIYNSYYSVTLSVYSSIIFSHFPYNILCSICQTLRTTQTRQQSSWLWQKFFNCGKQFNPLKFVSEREDTDS